ncbi:MAG TPA: hypothetical protein VNT22_01310 [Baekduia sp.]|nr:hypothetical protein [Baekduia sp.]
MPTKLEGAAHDLLASAVPVTLSIPRRDGTVQSVVIWAHAEGGEIFVNSAEGRAWPANLRRAKTATVTAIKDPGGYVYVSVTARLVAEAGPAESLEHINELAHKYSGSDFPETPGEVRVKFTLRPERVTYTDMTG